MRTAQEAIAAFAQWDGTAEYPAGSNKNWLTEWYGMGAVAWCAITVSRALIAAGFGTPERIDIPGVETTSRKGWAYCPYVEQDFRVAGRWYDSGPEPADLVLYDWDGDGWADHVGMVAWVEVDGSFYAWEGNTDEGVVRLKHRSMTYVLGFGRPPYSSPAPNPDPQPEEELTMIVFDGPPERGGGTWKSDGVFRNRITNGQTWPALEKAGAQHIGVAPVGLFDDLIDAEQFLRDLAADGVDLYGLVDQVAAKVADLFATRLGS